MALKEDKEFAISGKQKDSVREEPNAVSGMRVTIVQSREHHPLSHNLQKHEVEVCREEEMPEQKPV